MTDSVHMYSMNARGLGDHGKRVQVFSWLHNRPADIFFLQETHSTAFCEKKWKDDWGNNNIFSPMAHQIPLGLLFFYLTIWILR